MREDGIEEQSRSGYGAGRGLGAALTRGLGTRGCRVVVAELTEDGRELASELKDQGVQ